MAKNKLIEDTGFDAQKQMEQAKRYFDSLWRQKYDCALHDWVVNIVKTPHQLRLLACFATPEICELKGRHLVFKKNLHGIQAKGLWKSNFITYLQDMGLSIYEEPEEKPLKWKDMDERKRFGFAKAIWAKRDYIGREIRGEPKIHFADHLQETLCRIAEAPSPDDLKKLLESHGVDISLLEV